MNVQNKYKKINHHQPTKDQGYDLFIIYTKTPNIRYKNNDLYESVTTKMNIQFIHIYINKKDVLVPKLHSHGK